MSCSTNIIVSPAHRCSSAATNLRSRCGLSPELSSSRIIGIADIIISMPSPPCHCPEVSLDRAFP